MSLDNIPRACNAVEISSKLLSESTEQELSNVLTSHRERFGGTAGLGCLKSGSPQPPMSDIIDSLSYKLEDLEENPDEISIPKETIDEINKEYSRFIERKSNIIDILKDFHKRITSEVDEIKFPSLSKYLASKCGSILNNDHETIICNICNTFEAPNNKSLSAHKRSCKKKYCNSSIDSNIVIDTKP